MNTPHLCLALFTAVTSLALGEGPDFTLDIRWWSHLPPERPRAWLDEGIRLMEIGAQEESAAVLEDAHRRFPEDHDLTETFVRLASFYAQALQLLQAPRITDLDTPDEIRSSQRWPGGPVLLSPAVFATEYAVLSKPPGTFEKEVLPVALRAFGNDDEMILRAYANMCGSQDQDFLLNAQN